jgi:hypothetical protein
VVKSVKSVNSPTFNRQGFISKLSVNAVKAVNAVGRRSVKAVG